jgi:hypothetical protein
VNVVERADDTGSAPDAAPNAGVPRRRRWRGGRTLRDGRRLYWWVELIAAAVFYEVYSFIRNLHHSTPAEARANALDIIRWERALGMFHEQAVQAWADGWHAGIVAANYFYGSLHFIVTVGVMIFLYRKWTDDYPLWRNTLAIGTALALIGFAFFPLAPPRMFDGSTFHMNLGFIDTLAKDPAFWSFNEGAMKKISNQFAAMPSVHCAWAGWCACALVPRLRYGWAKALAILYPVCTVTVIVVTANHWFLDAVGGFFVLAVGYGLARLVTKAGRGPTIDVRADITAA